MPYLPQSDLDALYEMLIERSGVTGGWVDAWFSVLPAPYVAGLPPAPQVVKQRIKVALVKLNTDGPLPDGTAPIVLALDYLANDPDLQIQSEAKRLLSRLQLHTPGQAPSLSNELDRKSTRLNSSHLVISYAVF